MHDKQDGGFPGELHSGHHLADGVFQPGTRP